MDKKQINLIILLFFILLLGAANILIGADLNKERETTASSNIIYISNYSIGSVQKIEIENKYGRLVLNLTDDVWYAEGHEGETLDQEVMSELTYALAHITGERVVTEEEDTANIYGMLTPSATITTHHDGLLEQTFIIGDKAPAENEYYMQSSVFKKVFTVDMVYYTYGQIRLEDLLQLNKIGIAHADIEKIKIKNSLEEKFTIQKTADDNDISLCYWEFTEPFNHDIDTAVMYGTEEYDGMITYITQLSAEKAIGREGDEETYNLDFPIFTAEIFGYDGQYQSFSLGDFGDEEYYSIIFNDDQNIYAVSKESVPFVDYSAFMIAEPNLNLINIDSVDRVSIDLPNVKTEMNIEKTAVNNSDGTTSYSLDITIDNLNEGAAPDIEKQKLLFYQDIVTIKIDGLTINAQTDGKEAGIIIFYLSSNRMDEYIVNFYEYNQTHYLAKKNGEDAGYLVNKNSIEKLTKQYNLLLKGELS